MLGVLFAAINAGFKYGEIRQIRWLFRDDRDEFDRAVEGVRTAEESGNSLQVARPWVNQRSSTTKTRTLTNPAPHPRIPDLW